MLAKINPDSLRSNDTVGEMEISLPAYPDEVSHIAMQALFDHLNEVCEGALIVDRRAKIVWISPKYAIMLGIEEPEAAIGLPVDKVIPNSLMGDVVKSGEPILLDIMDFGSESFVVTRMPVKDHKNRVIGAIGFVLFDRLQYLRPLVAKYAQYQQALRGKLPARNERRAKYSFDHIIGTSPVARESVRLARRAAQLDTTVLLLGETGTGKELLAHAIHNSSPRAHRPFVTINAAAIPETLLEAEFFGTAPGAYTGADKKGREGKFKLAHGGTLFLDEIGDMPLILQAKLLRVLQEGEIEPLGANTVEAIDVRVIAATSLDLPALVEQGRFRADLYYRLNVLSITLPPLRERRSDIPILCDGMLNQIAERNGTRKKIITPSGLALLCNHEWPGNIRELRNALERLGLLSDKTRIDVSDVSKVIPDQAPRLESPVLHSDKRTPVVQPLGKAVADAERIAIINALTLTQGNKIAAAQQLGISRATLYHKLAQYSIRH